MAVKIVDRAYLQGQVSIYFALQSKVGQQEIHMKEGLLVFWHRVENVNCIGISEHMIAKR